MDRKTINNNDLLDTNSKLLDQLFLMTRKCREVELFAEEHKQLVENLVDILEDPEKLREILIDNFAIKFEPQKDPVETSQKETIEALKSQLNGLTLETQEKDDQIQVLKWTKITMSEEIGELMKQITKMEKEAENLTKYVKESEKLKEEVTMLKLDLTDKCKEFEALQQKMKKLEMKTANIPVRISTFPVPVHMQPQSVLIQKNDSAHYDYVNLSNKFQVLNMKYQDVCRERDQLKHQGVACMNHKDSIIRAQGNEISRLHFLLNEAESRIYNMASHNQVEELAFNCKQFQDDLNEIKLKMGFTDDMLNDRQQN